LKSVIAGIPVSADLYGAADLVATRDDPVLPLPRQQVPKEGRGLREARESADLGGFKRSHGEPFLGQQLIRRGVVVDDICAGHVRESRRLSEGVWGGFIDR